MSRRLRALVVAYAFPPVGGAGVQRAVKLVKYLPEHGVDAEVLTVENPSVPVVDSTFAGDLEGVVIHRARSLEPSYEVKKAGLKGAPQEGAPSLRRNLLRSAVGLARELLVPDPQVLWLPSAARRLRQIAPRFDAVVITAPPFSQFLLGPLALTGRAPVVLDYRDEWATLRASYENLQGPLNQVVSPALERRCLRQARAVVAATPAFRDNLLAGFPFLDPDRVHAISNGYDSTDFEDDLPAPSGDRLRLTYAGTVYHLTSPRGFLEAVRRVHQREPDLAKRLDVKFIGRVVPGEQKAFDGLEALGVSRHDYVPHGELMAHLTSSHVVMVIQGDVPGTEHIYPGKLFELMKVGRPVLALSREGALTELVRRHRLGDCFGPMDVDAIATYIIDRLKQLRDHGQIEAPDVDTEGIAKYHRRALAGRWAEVLRQAAS